MGIRAIQGVAGAFLAAVAALPSAAQYYDITNIGLGGGSQQLSIAAINASGQVAGSGYTASGEYHAFFASPSTGTIDIGTLGGNYSNAIAINASGRVIGFSYAIVNDAWVQHAFIWSPSGGIVDLGTLGGRWSSAYAINDAGTVVGISETADGRIRAFGWNATIGMYNLGGTEGGNCYAIAINATGQATGTCGTWYGDATAHVWGPGGAGSGSIGSTPGAFTTEGLAINDIGQVLGTAYTLDSNYNVIAERPFLWTYETWMTDIGTLGGAFATPRAVNSQGRVIGTSRTASNLPDELRAFTWKQGSGMTALTLGGNSAPVDINASGQVVGLSRTGNGAIRGFSWTEAGGIVDVGTFGGSSSIAYGVNDSGQVVGQAALANDTNTHAFLFENGVLKDLNNLVPSKPADLELLAAAFPSQNGSMVAVTNAGVTLLSPRSTSAAPPVIAPIAANDPVAVGSALSVSANFSDAASDTHTAMWTFGDGTPPQPGTVNETNGSGSVSGLHTYMAAGVYPVVVAVTDNGGLKSQVSRNVVVYDPSAGFVTGSGWILSPAGAYKDDAAAVGRAHFSFVAKYQKGANTPTGTTEFRFQTANLDFRSDTHDWLVVAGARAQFKGMGNLNGGGGYQFLLTAIDGEVNGGGGSDRFRIKIWRYDETQKQDVVVYDNQLGSSTEGTLSEGTVIGGGTIVIHTSKK